MRGWGTVRFWMETNDLKKKKLLLKIKEENNDFGGCLPPLSYSYVLGTDTTGFINEGICILCLFHEGLKHSLHPSARRF